ncbi:MAG: cytochrome B5 [Desulfuromonas sp.]|nr:MAG: cytochrome B5 [Desulfuromonas sp.]
MTLEELAKHDGRDGRKAFIAVNGTVYDVTDSPRWQNGLHPPDHLAGRDLSEELKVAPHVKAVVERFPVVGTLDEPAPETGASGGKFKLGIAAAIITFILLLLILLLR